MTGTEYSYKVLLEDRKVTEGVEEAAMIFPYRGYGRERPGTGQTL